MEEKMNTGLSAVYRRLMMLIALAVLAAGTVLPLAAEEASAKKTAAKKTESTKTDTEKTTEAEKDAEEPQLPRLSNRIKPGSSTLSMDLPFSFSEAFVDEEIPEDIKSWFGASKRAQADRDRITTVCSYVLFSQDYQRSYITGREAQWMELYLQGSLIEKLESLEEDKQIKSFRHRIMDIKLTGSKDKALLLKGSYKEGPRSFELWALQILHKKEVWQIVFFFDPKDEIIRDAVEAACFSAAVK